MLILITYDVNTEDAAGRKRLRQIAKQRMAAAALRAQQSSPPAWGAWIEITGFCGRETETGVAPRMGGVD